MKLNTTWLIFVCALALLTVGVVMVFSASSAITAPRSAMEVLTDTSPLAGAGETGLGFLKRQVAWALLSITALLVCYHLDYEFYRRLSSPLIVVAVILLLLVFVPGIGLERNYARRWIGWGGFQFQPSEFAKLALVLFMAHKLTERQAEIKSFFRGFLPIMFVTACIAGLVYIEPDLGTAVMLVLIVLTMSFVAGMRVIHLASLFIVGAVAFVAAVIAKPYRVRRVLAFLDPESDIQDRGWQLWQSLIAVGTGGVTGRGLGESVQKDLFLSERQTDFIFAIICEELGLIGALCVLALYGFFFVQGLRVAQRAPDLYGSLLATGVTAMIVWQALINMCVVVGLLPTKGLTLPLISYGGSSLLITMAGIGILMSVSRDSEKGQQLSRRRALTYART